jgi:hypothetical protein
VAAAATAYPEPINADDAGAEPRKAVTVALFAYNDPGGGMRRLERDLVPSLRHYGDWRFEIIVVDNSSRRLDPLADAVARLPWRSRYLWHGGKNLLYGPSMNLVARLAEHPFLLYACMTHGRMREPTWVEDLVRPMWHDSRIAMCGHLFPSAPPGVLGFADIGQQQLHVQGGVLAARTDVIRRFPYQEGEWSHGGSDVWQSYRLMQEGFALHSVPTVFSGWQVVAPAGPWKYVHDHADDR